MSKYLNKEKLENFLNDQIQQYNDAILDNNTFDELEIPVALNFILKNLNLFKVEIPKPLENSVTDKYIKNKQFIIKYIEWIISDPFKIKKDINNVLNELIYALEKENFFCYNCGFTYGHGSYEAKKRCYDQKCVNKVCDFCYDQIENHYIDDKYFKKLICKKGCIYE